MRKNLKQQLVDDALAQHEKLRDATNEHFLPLQVDNIKQIRSLLKHQIVIASAIVGFSVPVFNESNLIKNYAIFFIGLLTFLLFIIFAYYHLISLLSKENRDLATQHRGLNHILSDNHASILEFERSAGGREDFEKRISVSKKVIEDARPILQVTEKKDWAFDLLFWLFVFGIATILLSTTSIV